jgi:hypothetical protein
MSRPQKIHKPVKATFSQVLSAVAASKPKSKHGVVILANDNTAKRKQPIKAKED